MRRTLGFLSRTLIWLVGLFLGLCVLAAIALYFFFDPNDFKPQISAFLSEKTGLPLSIEGKIEFTVVPWVGLKAENINLAQAPHFGDGNFIHIKEIDLKIPLRELFELDNHLVFESLLVKGLDVRLVKQIQGQTNLDYYLKDLKKSEKMIKPEVPEKKTASTSPAKTSKNLTFALDSIEIKDANINFIDHKEKQTWAAKHFSLKSEYSLSELTPISTKFELSLTPFNQPATITGKGSVVGTIALSKPLHTIDFKTDLTLEIPNSPWKHAKINTTVKGDFEKQLKLQSLNLQSGTTKVSGNVTYPFDTSLPITFALSINELNINQLDAPSKPKAKETAAAPTGKPATSSSSAVATDNSSDRVLQGELSIDKLDLKDFTLQQVRATLRKKDAVVTLTPVTAKLLGGNLTANITHTLGSANAPTKAQGQLNGLALQSLLRALKEPEKISGNANIDFNVTQSGSNLNGIVKCNLTNGVIQGVDVSYYLSVAQSLLKKEVNPLSNQKQTPFKSLSATLMIHDNIIDNNDLMVLGNDFKANAEGSIYLNSQTVEYKLQAYKVYEDGKDHPNVIPLAIRIKGPISNPSVEPDLDVYKKKLLDKEVSKQINKQVKRGLERILSPDAADNDPDQKIEKEITNGLKKIFKIK